MVNNKSHNKCPILNESKVLKRWDRDLRSITLFHAAYKRTEFPKIYRKSVLHLKSIDLRYTQADAVQICGKFWYTEYMPK